MSNNQICGYTSLLYSVTEKPLDLWSKYVSLGGRVRRVNDDTLHGDKVIEIIGSYDNTIPTNITIPATMSDTLNIKLPILALVIKNLDLRFKLEIQILDREQYRRKFSFTTHNIEKLPSVDANTARIPLKLEECWNILEIDLQTLCYEAYGIDYEALQRIIIYPNCRLRRVYLQDRNYNYNETSTETYQVFLDMYMSKQGINFIEKACQTRPLEQRDLNSSTKTNEIATTTSTTIGAKLSKNVNNVTKLKNLNEIRTAVNLRASNASNKNHTSSAKFGVSVINFPSISKSNLLTEDIKFDRNKMKNYRPKDSLSLKLSPRNAAN